MKVIFENKGYEYFDNGGLKFNGTWHDQNIILIQNTNKLTSN